MGVYKHPITGEEILSDRPEAPESSIEEPESPSVDEAARELFEPAEKEADEEAGAIQTSIDSLGGFLKGFGSMMAMILTEPGSEIHDRAKEIWVDTATEVAAQSQDRILREMWERDLERYKKKAKKYKKKAKKAKRAGDRRSATKFKSKSRALRIKALEVENLLLGWEK